MDSPVFLENRNKRGVVALNGRRYRGRLKIWPSESNRLTVVNELGLEEYLYGVVPKEMPTSWPLEALKAQAVAARTYAICNLLKWGKYGFDLSDGVSDQAYGGYDAENANTNRAVDETSGMLILYEDEPIQAFYHSDSGGITENGSEVTGSNLPYLLSAEDVVKTNSPNSSWQLLYSPEDIRRQIISMKGSDLGEIRNVSIVERTSSNRAKKLLVSGTLGQKEFSGSEIRSVFQLKSTLFDILGNSGVSVISKKGIGQSTTLKEVYSITADGISKVNSNNAILTGGSGNYKQISLDNTYGFKFVGCGWGHGLGMSQWGARAMAENGYNYIDILQHYYNNVEIR
jgi:stage II sporulation protein D